MNMYVKPHVIRRSSTAPFLFRQCRLMAGFAVTATVALAQPVNPATGNAAGAQAEEPVVVLSPFVVAGTSDVGYEATESLAGTGLATKLTDLGASVSVITSKFFEDTGSNDLRDALVYQTNVEVGGFGGNFADKTPSLGGITGEPSFSNNTSTRVRGLAEATQARNFYRSLVPMNRYNTDRVEINRGANSLLFGVGSPAGIINYSTVRADPTREIREVGLSFGSHESWRATLDVNQPIVRDQLAVRVATVADHEKFNQKPAFNEDERVYAAVEWRIKQLERGVLGGTTIRANFEDGRIRSNNPRILPPTDRVSAWFPDTLAPELVALNARPKVTYDTRQNVGGQYTPELGTATIGTIQNVNRSPTFVFQQPGDLMPRDSFQVGSGLPIVGRPFVSNRTYFAHTGEVGTSAHAYVRETSRILRDYNFPDAEFFTSEHLRDPSIFNFFDILIDGPNKIEETNFASKEISLDQLLLEGRAGFELAYNHQEFDESRQSLIPSASPYVSIDVNTHMWTGEVNPNFGRPFTATGGDATYSESEVETSRAKAFYRLDLEERFKNRWGRVLGRHVFSGLAQREEFTTEGRGGGTSHFTPDLWTNGAAQGRQAAQDKQIVTWHYLGDSVADRSTPAGMNLPGIGVDRMDFQNYVTGQGLVIGRVIPPSNGVAAQNLPQYRPTPIPLTVLREDRMASNTSSNATKSRRTLDSVAFAIQSNWLADHVVSTVGWRHEQSSTLRVSAPRDPNGEGFAIVNDPSYTLEDPALLPQEFEETLFSWSVVGKVPRGWVRKLPVLSTAGFYYGVSENFDPPESQTINPFGVVLPPPGGETKEYGLNLEILEGKVAMRINFFETTQTGSFNGSVGGLAAAVVGRHTTMFNTVRAGNIADRGDGFPANYVAPPQALLDLFDVSIDNGLISTTNPGVQDTSDFTTEGVELEVLVRPFKGLSVSMNVAKQESVRTNTGAATRKLLFETPTASGRSIVEEWTQDWAYFIPVNAGGIAQAEVGDRSSQNSLGGSVQLGIINRWNVNALADGGPVHELRKWRANAVANYDFQGERLRGWGIGGAVRWLDKAAIGSPVGLFGPDLQPATDPADPANIRVQDVRNPIFGPTETYFDAWVSYRTKLWNDRVGLKVQLNVRNLNVGDQLRPVGANPDGSIAVWQIEEPRRYTLSAKFSF